MEIMWKGLFKKEAEEKVKTKVDRSRESRKVERVEVKQVELNKKEAEEVEKVENITEEVKLKFQYETKQFNPT